MAAFLVTTCDLTPLSGPSRGHPRDALSQRFAFSGEPLTAAISATFGSRGGAVPQALPVTFREEFALDPAKLTQWGAFVRKARVDPAELSEVVAALRRFLAEPYLAAARGEPFTKHWPAGGPWG